jgi:PAS domain S-box-containing protein
MRTSVLLVEDSEDDAFLIGRVLAKPSRVPFEIAHVHTLREAEQHLATFRYDAVVADLGLPDSDGLSTFSRIHAAAGAAAVIVLTGDDREELGLRAVELGAQEYLVKHERAWAALPMTIRYAVERARRQQELEEVTTALSRAVDAIATVDAKGLCLAANPAFEALLGFTRQELLGTDFRDLVPEADRARLADAFSSAPAVEELEARMIRKGGRIVPIQIAIVARAGGRGFFCFVRDLTRQKQLEGRIAAESAITAVGSLASGLAHEVNNPLAVVLANVEEAARVIDEIRPGFPEAMDSDITDVRSMLAEALSASQRVQLIVRDLRPFACADDRRARVDLNAVVEACCNIAFAEIRHRAKLIKDLNAIPPVLGSEAKLAQVFLNLLVNAAQAVPDDTLDRNEIHVTTRQHDRTSVVIEVGDTGRGIAPSEVSQVFEPFYSTKPHRPGMGLTICAAAIAAHGGELSIHPREGGGTTVRIVLRTFEADLAAGAAAQIQGAAQRRVLVVDDDPLVLRSLTRVLARDFEVASARNGREALDIVRAGGTFDAMLCDLMMPELSGIELHELLEKDDPELARRTVFLTGGAFSPSAQTFLDSVGQPHLEKPVDLKTVRDLLLELSRKPHAAKWIGSA